MKLFVSWPFYDKSIYEKKWKDNRGYATIVLNAIRIIKTTIPLEEKDFQKGWIKHLKLEISKISRLFVYVDSNKYFSCFFPFSVSQKDDKFNIWYEGIEITDKLLSEIFGLLNDIENSSFYNRFQDEDEEQNYSENAYQILERLITAEPGYIRYDYDAKNARGHIHPKIHLDINMSKASTFKVGIFRPMAVSVFEGVFNKNIDCFYLIAPSKIKFTYFLNKPRITIKKKH